jgi:cell division septation protein DedD
MKRSIRSTLAITATLLGCAVPAMAQLPLMPTTPKFQEVVRLAQDGYGDSARTLITRTLASTAVTDASYPEALFTAAMVASSGDETARDLKRIVVEFPASAWGDKAQLRLAQLSYGSGDMNDVTMRVGRLFSDYPNSSVIPMAALWGARAAFEQQKLQVGCDWITRGLARVGDDIEVKNQLLYAKQHCNVGPGVQLAPNNPDSFRMGPPPTAAPDTSRPTPPAPPPARAPATPASPWRVQVVAIADQGVIRRMTQKLEDAGFKVYQVPGPKGLTKVQAGPFATRTAAVAALARLRKVAGGAPFVTPAP